MTKIFQCRWPEQVYSLGRIGGAWITKRPAFLVLALVLTAYATPFCSAQTISTGTVSGNVTDSGGAVVPNAIVTIKSIDEGTVNTAKVNKQGEYLFSQIKPGSYTLTVLAPGFETFKMNALNVNASENVRINAPLAVGSVSTTVTVDAPSATVDVRSATIATVIDPTLVENLPVDGNNVVELAALLPGVVDVNAPTTFTSDTGGPTYSSGGSRSNQNLFLVDGAMWNNVYYNTGLNYPPPLMLQEVSVQSVNYKAQYGRNVGSVFNVLTKSGTNKFHGQLWEYIQNKALNASDYLSHLNPKLVQNQFGASVGGPILNNKLFFFLGLQDLRSASEVVSNTRLPTLAERGLSPDGVTPLPCVSSVWSGKHCFSFAADYPAGGNLITSGLMNPYYPSNPYSGPAQSEIRSTAATAAGQSGIYNAKQCDIDLTTLANSASSSTLSASILPNAEIPYECVNPVAVNFYKKYLPIPKINGVPVTQATTLPTTANQPRNDWNGLARVDWNTGHGHTIDARYYVTSVNDQTSNSVTPTGTAVASYDIDANSGGITSGNLGDTWVLTPNLLNVLRVAYKRYNYTVEPIDPTTFIDLGSNVTDPGHPTLPILAASGRFTVGSTNSGYSYSVNADTEIDDDITWTHGRHNIQIGAQWLDLQYIHRYDQPISIIAGGSYTGSGIGDFTMGLITSEKVGNSTNISAAEHVAYFYLQDDWRATPRLTLNLGLRYEFSPPWYQPDGQSVTFVPGYQSYRFPNTPSSLAFQGDPGIPNSIIKTSYSNFGPRFGLAYDVFGSGRMVIRAGFGIFYDALNANTTGIGQPYHYTANYSEPNGSFSQPLLDLTPVPANYTTPATAIFATPLSVNFADPNVTEPYSESVNVGIQERIAAATLAVSYVGKFGRHQIVPVDLNPTIYSCNPANTYYQTSPTTYCLNATTNQASNQARVTYPGFNYGGQGIVDNNSVGSSSYNALQVQYIQRSKRWLTSLASYTYSRSLDDQSSGTTNTNALSMPPNVNTNYGPSDYQATHIVSAGWTLNLPAPHTGPKIERAILSDWVFGGIFSARTGHPFTPILDHDVELNAEPNQRAPLAPGLTKYQPLSNNRHRTDKVNQWFNVCSFSSGFTYSGTAPTPVNDPCGFNSPLSGGYTNGVSRNFLYGPAFIESDFSLRRSINLKVEGMKLQMRVDAFNVFNTPNLANPNATIPSTASSYVTGTAHGAILATTGNNGSVGTNGRRIQLAFILRY